MKSILFFFSILLIHQDSIHAQTGWFVQQSGTNQNIESIFFLNSETGYLCTALPGWMSISGSIIKTTNGGQNWTTIYSSGPNGPAMYKVYFMNEITGFAIGSTLSSTVFLKTIDGGVTWSIVIYNFNCSDFQFINTLTCFACGGSYIKTSTDGGNNWSNSIIPGVMLSCIYFPNSLTGYAAGNQSYEVHPAICKTTNGGVSWSDTVLMNFENVIYSIYFVNSNTGYFVGGQNENYYPLDCIILKTIDMGNSFSRQLSGMGSNLYSTTFINQNIGFAVGGKSPYPGNLIVNTTNGGNNWVTQQTPGVSTLLKTLFIDSVSGFAAGLSGTIYKTTNGGISKIQSAGNGIPFQFKLFQNIPNPFNSITSVRFSLPISTYISFIMYDILGREFYDHHEFLNAGNYVNTIDLEDKSSGIYFYRLTTGEFSSTKKMILVK